MPLERVFLYLAILAFVIYGIVIAFAMVAMLPWGLIGLAVLAFMIYIAWRLVSDANTDEERYYEDNFDQ